MDKLIGKYKPIMFPLATVFVTALLSFFVGKFLLDKVNFLRGEISQTEQKVSVLEQRLEALNSAKSQVAGSVSVASIALPDKNPTILVVQQLRKEAGAESVLLRSLSVTARSAEAAEGQISNYSVSFYASGELENVATFLKRVSDFSPIVNLNSIQTKTSINVSGVEAYVNLTAFSAPYPTDLPSLLEPLSGLSDTEQSTLSMLQTFSMPSVGTSVPDLNIPSGGKPDPFSAPTQ